MPDPRTPSLRRLLITHEAMFIVLVVVTGGVGAFWGWQWQQWSAESIRLNGLSHVAQEIRSRLFKQIQEVSVAGLREDPRAGELNSERARAIQELFNELRRRSRNRAEDYAVQGMQTAFGHLQANLRGALDDPLALNRLVRAKLFDPAFEQRFVAEFETAFESFGGLVNQQLAAQEESIRRWTRLAPYALTGPILIGFGLLLFSRRSLTREFIEPMRAVLVGMREVSGGNLHYKLGEYGGREARDLASGINTMAAELEASRDAIVAAERQAALGALVPVVAHNIRNPLAAIRANAQLLDGSESDAERGEIRSDIIETVDRLGRWVNALVSYLHPLEARRMVIPAHVVMNAALTLLEARIVEAGLSVRREPWDESAEIQADPDLLEQALYCLLNNAVEASRAGQVLALGIVVEGDGVRFSINDEGGGIPFKPEPADLEPGPSTKRFGTGLGIPIAYKICAAHGFKLEFHIAQGVGTRVEIRAPLRKHPQDAAGHQNGLGSIE